LNRYFRLVVLVSALVVFLPGQLVFYGDNQLRYGESKNGFIYSENILNTYLQYRAFSSWIQFEFSDPPELGRNFNGLRKVRLEYIADPIHLQVGDIYAVWGRGLVLNQIDDQAIDRDNGLRGLAFTWSSHHLKYDLIAGQADIYKISNQVLGFNDRRPNYRMHHNLFGSDLAYSSSRFTLGVSFLQSRELHPIPFNEYFLPDTLSLVHRLHGIRLVSTGNRFDFFAEYVDRRTTRDLNGTVSDTLLNRGNGFYGNVNLYFGSWAVTIDYKHYAFARLNPYARWDFVNNPGFVLEFQLPPIVLREQSTRLLSRLTHQTDFNDELGYQVNVTGPIKDWFTLLVHYARASRHESWITNPDFTWRRSTKKTILPLSDPAANPFREIYLEADGLAFDNRLHYQIGYGYTFDVPNLGWNIVSDTSRNLQYELVDAFTIPTAVEYTFLDRWSLIVKAEYQELQRGLWYHETNRGEVVVDSLVSFFPHKKQYNLFFSLGISKSPQWSVTLILDRVSEKELGILEEGEIENPLEKFVSRFMDVRNSWISLELVYNITSTHRLSLMYGSQQGGLLCSNGVCRYIAPFEDGFKLSLVSLF
jgi:hypothetical protein